MASVSAKKAGETSGTPVYAYTITNGLGLSLTVLNYGATITHLFVPDQNAVPQDIVLGFDNFEDYLNTSLNPYFGASIGRCANRINHGVFTLDGQTHHLAKNQGGVHHLHGGVVGFDKRVWNVIDPQGQVADDTLTVTMELKAHDGEEEYPGNVLITAAFCVSLKTNTFSIIYNATTDKPTVVNLTNHSYFNLSAMKEPTVHQHEVEIPASAYLEVDDMCAPTGKVLRVDENPLMDLRKSRALGGLLTDSPPYGYDHHYILDQPPTPAPRRAATAYSASTGILLHVHTNQPGLQLYSANYVDCTGRPYKTSQQSNGQGSYLRHSAFCLETQGYPNAINFPQFPSVVLRPGETYTNHTIFHFSCKTPQSTL
eukprot:Colp12_sorted_trinity150504_noHs@15613